MNNIIEIEVLDKNAEIPTRSTPESPGLDLVTPRTFKILPNELIRISTRITVKIPTGYYGRITDRVSMLEHGLISTGGLITSGYDGVIAVYVRNATNHALCYQKGTKIAQLVIAKCEYLECKDVGKQEQPPQQLSTRSSMDNSPPRYDKHGNIRRLRRQHQRSPSPPMPTLARVTPVARQKTSNAELCDFSYSTMLGS